MFDKTDALQGFKLAIYDMKLAGYTDKQVLSLIKAELTKLKG
jgi:hypothetical protein